MNLLLLGLGIAAIGVPLWVHLRLGAVRKRATVSTLRLMRAAPQTSRTPRRLVDLPLFLLRALILLLVALGFARLLIPGFGGSDSQEYAVMILDVSGSLQAENGREWQELRTKALDALSHLHAASKVAVVLSPDSGRKPEWTSPGAALREVRALRPGNGSNRLNQAIRTAAQMFAELPDDHPKVLYVLSDFQQSGLAGIEEAVIPQGVDLRVTKIGPERLVNRGVTVDVVSAGVNDIALYGFTDGAAGTLEISDNEGTRELAVPAGTGAAMAPHLAKTDDWITRRITIHDADALAADNTASDVFRGQKMIPVWLWEPNPATDEPPKEPAPPRALAPTRTATSVTLLSRTVAGRLPVSQPQPPVETGPRVFDQASYYVGRALQPAADPGMDSPSRFRPITLEEKNLDGAMKTDNDDAPRLLIIPASEKPPEKLAQSIVRAGGSVILFGGPQPFAPALEKLAGVHPGAEESTDGRLAKISPSNPLWGSLDPETRAQLARLPVTKRHALTVDEGTALLAKFADGVPFVTERRTASGGSVIFVNASADRKWGDWPARAQLFVPALHLLAARALPKPDASLRQSVIESSKPVQLQLPAKFAGRSFTIAGVGYPVQSDGSVRNVVFPEPGVADIVLDDGTNAGRIAVNFPSSESALESFPEPVVRQRLESLRQSVGASSVRWENEEIGGLAWKLCLLAAALLLMIEPVVANRRIAA